MFPSSIAFGSVFPFTIAFSSLLRWSFEILWDVSSSFVFTFRFLGPSFLFSFFHFHCPLKYTSTRGFLEKTFLTLASLIWKSFSILVSLFSQQLKFSQASLRYSTLVASLVLGLIIQWAVCGFLHSYWFLSTVHKQQHDGCHHILHIPH